MECPPSDSDSDSSISLTEALADCQIDLSLAQVPVDIEQFLPEDILNDPDIVFVADDFTFGSKYAIGECSGRSSGLDLTRPTPPPLEFHRASDSGHTVKGVRGHTVQTDNLDSSDQKVDSALKDSYDTSSFPHQPVKHGSARCHLDAKVDRFDSVNSVGDSEEACKLPRMVPSRFPRKATPPCSTSSSKLDPISYARFLKLKQSIRQSNPPKYYSVRAGSADSEGEETGDSIIGSSTNSEAMEYFSTCDGPCTSSDLAVSSMSSGKKDKLCLVCSDKALGYNFNAVSCESCKAFFRRNAHKVIRGRCEGKCEVTVESRSFCKRCRLAKCFYVGMRKDMILNDEQKKQRKQKIIINKLRRQGQLPAQDTYSASAKDLLSPIRGMVAKHPDQFLASHSGFTSPDMLIKQETVDSANSPGSATSPTGPFGPLGPSFTSPGHYHSSSGTPVLTYPTSSTTPEAVISYTPWSESQEQVQAAINMMSESDQFLIHELMDAMDAGSFLIMSYTNMKMIPSNPEEFINMAELFVRKVIKVAKHITFFKQLHKDDQISLLKGSVVDIMMLRSAVNYDPFTESWSLNTKGCISQGASEATGQRISAEILKSGSHETKQLFMTYSKFIKSLMSTIHGDLLALKLLIIMSLFSADRMPMVSHNKIQEIQETYARILEDYMGLRFNQEPTLFARVVMKLTDLRNINEVHSKMLLRMNVDEFEPLLLEIFDLPAETTEVSIAGKRGATAAAASSTSDATSPSSSS